MPNAVYYLIIGFAVFTLMLFYFIKLYTVNAYLRPHFSEKGLELTKVEFYFSGVLTASSEPIQFTYYHANGSATTNLYFKCFVKKGNKDICYVAEVSYFLLVWVKAINYKEWRK